MGVDTTQKVWSSINDVAIGVPSIGPARSAAGALFVLTDPAGSLTSANSRRASASVFCLSVSELSRAGVVVVEEGDVPVV